MTAKPRIKSKTPLSASAGRALRRAARSAREAAKRYDTAIYISRAGKVVAQRP